MNKWKIINKLFNVYALYYFIDMYICDKLPVRIQKYIQNRRLRKLVKRAYKIPFYKERFDKVGVKPNDIKSKEDLSKLPVLTKAEYREWMNEELKDPIVKNFKLTHTSGSTGIPTTNIYPPDEYACHYMMDFFCWHKGGAKLFTGKTLTCSPGDSNVGKGFFQKLGILRRDYFNMSWPLENIVKKINSYKPDFILGYSSELVFIAEYILGHNIELSKPLHYCAGGENVDGLSEKILKNVFGSGMINYYGCTEMADFAYRCPGEKIYKLNNTKVLVLINASNGNLETIGKGSIVATPLYRMYYPLINYEIGDNIRLEEYNDEIIISEIEGRLQDIFVWYDGTRTTHKDFWLVSRNLNNIFQIRYIQIDNRSLVLQVVKDKKSNVSEENLEKYLICQYRKILNESIKITFEWYDVIPPDPNGKIRNMISMIN